MIGDGWSPADHDGWQDAPRPADDRSTQVDRNLDALKAGVAEVRAAYRGGVPNKHSPEL